MRIVFDLDGVICELKKPSESYADVIPKNDVIEKMMDLDSASAKDSITFWLMSYFFKF